MRASAPAEGVALLLCRVHVHLSSFCTSETNTFSMFCHFGVAICFWILHFVTTIRYMAVGCEDCSMKVYCLCSQRVLYRMTRWQVWELKTGDIVSTGRAHSSPVEELSWAPDEKQLVRACSKRHCARVCVGLIASGSGDGSFRWSYVHLEFLFGLMFLL